MMPKNGVLSQIGIKTYISPYPQFLQQAYISALVTIQSALRSSKDSQRMIVWQTR